MKNEKKYSNYQENVIILINSLYSFNHAKLNLQDQRTKIPRLLTQHHAKAKKKKKILKHSKCNLHIFENSYAQERKKVRKKDCPEKRS